MSVAGSDDDRVVPAEELEARRARVCRELGTRGLDACVVLAPDTQLWLCGLDSFISGVLPQALVLLPDGAVEPTLVVWDADIPLARATSTIEDIRGYRFGVDDPAVAFATVIRERCPRAQLVGFDGSSRAVPHAFGAALGEAIAPARLADCSALLADARAVKSPFELECLRRAGRHAEAGLLAAREHARPGISERQLAAAIEHAMRSSGTDYPSIPTELTSGPRTVFAHGTPTDRVLESEDLVHVEIGGVEARYNAVGIQTFCVVDAPAAGVRLYEIALACLRAGLAAVEPGVEARAVEAPALAVLREAGTGDAFKMRFGYGVGLGYPPTWLDPLEITRTSTQRLVPGSTFVLHACLLDEATPLGVLVGGTYAVGERGLEQLAGAGAIELTTV
jgi:Xaa-Pro aminopeptidase